ncbi:MAG: HypC/HybG/HupF family hydrogenase formation chaperone [Campylobacteraceae bacterium]|jgi:hydrogenase expression/formation protein HypC|nr:HypC/HybG/HupF family hydrogenase formation chaperone [Campylobacteraceae bacterium]
MCLSIPSRVVEIDENNNATVETLGVLRKVSLDLIDEEVQKEDYVLIHVGFAMSKMSEKEAKESLALYEEIADKMRDGMIDELEGDMGFVDRLN